MSLIKEIFKFILGLAMLLFAIGIISEGGKTLGIGVFAIIPFVYFMVLSNYKEKEQEEKIESLESNVKYYKSRLEQYESPDKEV